MSTPVAIDINKILQLLPHRYPFLLVDRVIEITPRETITALKNVTMNEPFFQGHFPTSPIMPGVLILEALAQAGGILVHLQNGGDDEKIAILPPCFTAIGLKRAYYLFPRRWKG